MSSTNGIIGEPISTSKGQRLRSPDVKNLATITLFSRNRGCTRNEIYGKKLGVGIFCIVVVVAMDYVIACR